MGRWRLKPTLKYKRIFSNKKIIKAFINKLKKTLFIGFADMGTNASNFNAVSSTGNNLSRRF